MIQARETWRRFADYYDSYVKDFSADLAGYLEAARGAEAVVELGCGSGRVLEPLLAAGARVSGVDISDEMLAKARARLAKPLAEGRLDLLNHDLAAAPLEGVFDLALVTFYTFNYLLERPERFLANLRACLAPGGLAMLDLFYPRSKRDPQIDGQWTQDRLEHRGRTVAVRERRSWLPRKGVEERVQVFDDGESLREVATVRRYYPPAELGALLAAAGFAAVEFAPGYGKPWREALTDGDIVGNYLARARAGPSAAASR